MDRRYFFLATGLSALEFATPAKARPSSLVLSDASWRERWTPRLSDLERGSGGRLGVFMLDTGTGVSLGWRESERFAICSTFKMLLAGWILSLVDQGKESLTQTITYPESAVVPYSPISGPQAGKGGLTVAQLCAATVSWSDNTAANVLLQRHGGPQALTAFLRGIGDAVTRLDRFEPELNAVAPGDTRDTTTPQAMLASMRQLVLGEILSCDSRAHLKHWLRDCRTGDKRLRAGAPGWLVGDKTGTYGNDGISNDVAILWPQDQAAPVLLTCYLQSPRGEDAARDAVIAEVARTVLAARSELRAS